MRAHHYQNFLASLLLLLLLAGCATQKAGVPDQSGPRFGQSGAPTANPSNSDAYPYKNPMLATVLGTPKALQAKFSDDANFSIRTLKPLVQRDTPPTLRYARPLQYVLTAQDKPAPLAFIIAGTGDTALSSHCVLLSRALHAVGYSTVCLPSPTSVTFMLGAAEHPVPGRMPADVDGLYHMMNAIRGQLGDDGLDITGYALTGWSLGASEAAFVAHRDSKDHAFDFQRVLLLNPAVSLEASVVRMDKLLEDNLPGGIDNLPMFLARILGDIKQAYDQDHQGLSFNEEALFEAYARHKPDPKQAAALIGVAFRLALADMAFAADELTHSDVIVPRDVVLGPYDPLNLYFERSIRMSFGSYIDKLLLPYWNRDGHHLDMAELVSEDSLHSIASFLASDDRIGVFTNADDPILGQGDIEFLRETFGQRARIRPHGGHLGNLSYKKTVRAIQDYFSP